MIQNKRQAIIWTNADRIHWRIYAALEGDELTPGKCWKESLLTPVPFVK